MRPEGASGMTEERIWIGYYQGSLIGLYTCMMGVFLRYETPGIDPIPELDILFGYGGTNNPYWSHPDFPNITLNQDLERI